MHLRVTPIAAAPVVFSENGRQRRAAAYARVSTDHDDQKTSCEAQIAYYTRFIESDPDLTLVNVYTDEGVSGTSTEKRSGFCRMIEDALAGRIDLIITKSVSRFARNTVDSLSTIRLLRENRVECYFEKENIRTFDSKGELLLTIMSSIAQEESRSISENCTWGQRKRFADGKATVPFSRFLGYDRGEDGNLVVNDLQAEIVREIYKLFLDGMSPYSIAKLLTARNIPTPGGKRTWGKATITSILTNEKYRGDALLQKVYTTDFLSKRKALNRGEVTQYYVEKSHEPIISGEDFERAQREFDRRRRAVPPDPGRAFSNKVMCGVCGAVFSVKIWRSTRGARPTVWRCVCKECSAPNLSDAELRLVFRKAMEQLLADREGVIERCANVTKRMASAKALKTSIEKLRGEERAAAERELAELLSEKRRLREFRLALKHCPKPLGELSEELLCELAEKLLVHITIYEKSDIRVTFADGTEIKAEI